MDMSVIAYAVDYPQIIKLLRDYSIEKGIYFDRKQDRNILDQGKANSYLFDFHSISKTSNASAFQAKSEEGKEPKPSDH